MTDHTEIGVLLVLHNLVRVNGVDVKRFGVRFGTSQRQEHTCVKTPSQDPLIIVHESKEQITVNFCVWHLEIDVGFRLSRLLKVLVVVGSIPDL